MYLASEIDQTLDSKKACLLGTPSYYYITSVLNRAFKNKIPFKFRYETYLDYSKEDFSVSGLYDMDKDVKYIILNFSREQRNFSMDRAKWKDFRFAVSQVCQHESIHQLQWQHRELDGLPCPLDFRNLNGTITEEKEYLADLDEIDAYGHDIAMEIKFCYPKQDPYQVLRDIGCKKKLWSYNYYKKIYKGDDWSDIKKRLLKKTFLWLPHVTV